MTDWEARFVESNIEKSKRDRYLSFLRSPKRRGEVLDRLNHSLDYIEASATRLDPPDLPPKDLIRLLRRKRVAAIPYLIADDDAHDGRETALETALKGLLGNPSDVVPICPPEPIAVYKPEDPADLVLFEA